MTERGKSPTPNVLGGLEGAIALPQQDRHGVGTAIGRGQIQAAIGIEVAHRDGERPRSHPNVRGGLEGAIALAQQDGHGVWSRRIGRGQIEAAVGIEVAHRDGDRPASHPHVLGGLEGAIALAQQDRHGAGHDIGRGQIEAAIGIEVAHRDGDRPGSHPNVLGGLEGAIALAQQDRHGVGKAALAVARSRRPSALKSPTVTDERLASHRHVLGGLKGAIALAQQDRHGARSCIGGGQIEAAIAIEVAHRDGERIGSHPERPGRPGRCHRPGPAEWTRCRHDIGRGQIQAAIAIEVAHRDGDRKRLPPHVLGGLEGAIALAQQDRHGVGQTLAVARSRRPSALKSPTVTERGLLPTANVLGGLEGAIALAQQDGHGVGICIGRGQIQAAIGIEVAHRDGERNDSHRRRPGRPGRCHRPGPAGSTRCWNQHWPWPDPGGHRH